MWGVNDDGALGRDTDLDSEDEDEDNVLSPKESTPTAIPIEFFGKGVEPFAQVAATDSASFALTLDGSVYGWGTFSVSSSINPIVITIC
jgi:regulator of chromosome condensation